MIIPYWKIIPWAGYGIAAVLFFFWLDGRENLASQIEQCNTEKITAVAEAERVTRQTVEAALQRQMVAIEERRRKEVAARAVAEQARIEAERNLAGAQGAIDRLMREARNTNATIEQKCLVTTVPADVLRVL